MADSTKTTAVTAHRPETGPQSAALDGYRALAIAIVMLNHTRHVEGYPSWLLEMNAFLRGGVTAFMVLSGYLITLSLLREEVRSGVVGGWAFWRRQAVRFYIPVVAYLALACLWFSGRPEFSWGRTLRVLWMDPNTAGNAWWTGHLYSLAAQLQFCVWWPLLLRLIPRGHRLLPVTLLMLVAVGWRTLGRELAMQSNDNFLRTDFVYGSLLVGAWWAILVAKGRMEWILRLQGRQLVPLFLLAAFVIVFTRSPSAILGVFSDGLRDWVAPWREKFPVVVTVRALTALSAMMAFGCLAFLLHSGRPARIAGLFASPLITWLGRISFSVYLWQNVFCFGITGTFADRFPLNLLASVACGFAAYYLFELPSLRWRSRLKRPPQDRNPPAGGGSAPGIPSAPAAAEPGH